MVNYKSRKSKKNWRKNTDIKEIENFLDERARENLLGGPIEIRPNQNLFIIDKEVENNKLIKSTKQRYREKVLHVDKVLSPNPLIPDVPHKLPKKLEIKKITAFTEAELAKFKSKQKLRYEQRQKVRKIRTTQRKRKTNYDLWDNENEKNATKEENDDFLEVAIHPPVKKPDTWIEKASNIPAIEITAPGNSYRPLSDDHQDVLGETVAKLIKMEDEKKFWKKKLAFDKSKIVPEITVDDEIKIELELAEDANNENLDTTSVPVEWNKKNNYGSE